MLSTRNMSFLWGHWPILLISVHPERSEVNARDVVVVSCGVGIHNEDQTLPSLYGCYNDKLVLVF